MKLSELASSFRCNEFEDYIYKNGTLNTRNAEIIIWNLKQIKPFLRYFHVLTKSLMKFISESFKYLIKTAILEYGKNGTYV